MAHNWSDYLKSLRSSRRRRHAPRIPAPGAFCTEISDGPGDDRYAIISDVSPTGLRLHRPYAGAQARTVRLEFDLPGIDELFWAKGIVCFDAIWQSAEGRVLQTTGVELANLPGRHVRLLRDYAVDQAPRFGHYAERRAAAR